MKRKMAAWLALGIITLAAALGLALVNQVTKDIIVKQEEEAKVAARKAVLPSAGDFERVSLWTLNPRVSEEDFTKQFIGKALPISDGDVDIPAGAALSAKAIINAINSSADKLGVKAPSQAAEAPAISYPAELSSSSKGYGGPVAVKITVNEDQTIAAILVGDEDFAETAGLGTKVKDEAFTSLFIGKKVPLQDGDIDVIAGSTVSSKAVINAVNKAAGKLTAAAAPAAPAAPAPAAEAAAISYPAELSSSSKGYGGPVAVKITVNEDQTIAAILVGDEDFAETAGLGTKVKDEAFTSLFIGKKVPLQAGDIDVIAGSTVSSKAVINAVNKAAGKLTPAAAAPAVPAAAAPVADTPAISYPAELSSSSKGYGGPVAVKITVNEDQTIAAILVGDEDFAETAGLGTKVKDEAFTSLFIGKKVPLQDGDIHVITGSTVSSKAVINAVNKAAGKLAAAAAPVASDAAKISYPAELSSSFKGFGGSAAVTVTINEDHTIAALKVADEGAPEPAAPGGLDEVYVGKAEGKLVGYVGSVEVSGYGGPVQVTVGLDPDGKITGLSVGGSAFAETAGLGAKAKDEAFTSQFIGKMPPVRVSKTRSGVNDNSVDVITSATITTNAVNGGVERIAETVESLRAFVGSGSKEEAAAETTAPAITWPAELSSSAKGYGGPVAVRITINEDRTIAAITVGDEDFAETAGLGTKVRDEAFTSLFIGKKVPIQADDIDVITGSTVSSKAVINAVNKAADKLPK